MKTTLLSVTSIALFILGACQNPNNNADDSSAISNQSITVHDEIMPQISSFDKHTVLIDSLLGNLATVKAQNSSIDTNNLKSDLSNLKTDLESATDKMMTWMKDYEPDSNDVDYQKGQLESINILKNTFDEVSQNADKHLTPYIK